MVIMFKRFLGRISKEDRENILDDLESEDYSRLELDISKNKVLYRVVSPGKDPPPFSVMMRKKED